MQSPIFMAGGGKRIIGMVHLSPLPGTPFHSEGSFDAARETAVRDAVALDAGGADGCLIQTVDRVYPADNSCDPARLAAMTMISHAVVEATRKDFIVGLQIMSNAAEASIAVAKVVGARFVRVTAFIGQTASQWGMLRGDALQTIAYRNSISTQDIEIVADIHTQHFHWEGSAASLGQIARWAKQAGAGAVCVGDREENVLAGLAAEVRAACPDLPIILSGHTNHANARRMVAKADGALVGTCLQAQGWSGPVDEELVRSYVASVNGDCS